jgi:hypothetical protein
VRALLRAFGGGVGVEDCGFLGGAGALVGFVRIAPLALLVAGDTLPRREVRHPHDVGLPAAIPKGDFQHAGVTLTEWNRGVFHFLHFVTLDQREGVRCGLVVA